MPTTLMAFEQILAMAEGALRGCGVSAANAASVAHSIACAERDGQAIVGLSYLPTYCDHAACGKVDGQAQPTLAHRSPVALHVDAAGGFAHPALALGLAPLALAARTQGVAVLAVGNSYACGSLGYFVEQLAAQGLVALMAANASPSIAPWGGKRPFFGTNPIAFGVPRAGRPPFIIDQSSSTVARVAVLDAHRRGVPLPEGWALDAEGQPTQDPQAAMKGSMMPLGGYKGAGLALMVDVLAAGLTGAHYSHEVSSFGDTSGGPPCSGQLVVAFDPERLRGPGFADALERMLQAMQEGSGVRLPGDRRLEARARHASGVTIDDALIATLQRYAVQGSSAAPGDNLVPIILNPAVTLPL
jgi:(2R)-3-sulfolactate dehydrogenase (NADP+)